MGMSERVEVATASPVLFIGMKAYIWVDVFGMWQDGIWDGAVWRVADNDTVENKYVSRWAIQ